MKKLLFVIAIMAIGMFVGSCGNTGETVALDSLAGDTIDTLANTVDTLVDTLDCVCDTLN